MTSEYFPKPIRGEWLTPRRYKLSEPFVYHDPEKDIRVEIPAGFDTDFNSVPRALWTYFAPHDCLEAGLVHDWLYDAPGGFISQSMKPPLNRQQCDDVHRRILHLCGFRLTKRNAIYGVLRSAGWNAWRKHRALDVGVESN